MITNKNFTSYLLYSILAAVFMIMPANLVSMEKPESILLAHEDKNAYPWVIPLDDGGYAGLDLDFLNILASKIGVKIEFKAYPWARCLEEMRQGNVNGVFASSYRKEREAMGRYPMKNGQPDTGRMIHSSGYSLYILKDSPVGFDGKNFINLNGNLGVQRAFSIIPELTQFNVSIDDGTADPEVILMKLFSKRISAAAIQTARGDNVLKNNQRFRNSIIKHETSEKPFDPKPYFVMFSHQFYEKYPEFAETFWNKMNEVLNSKEYDKKVQEFYKKY